MLFNSISFAIFLPIVFVLYWFLTNKSLKLQNLLLLVASFYFYSCWDWRFVFLLLFSILPYCSLSDLGLSCFFASGSMFVPALKSWQANNAYANIFGYVRGEVSESCQDN